MIYGLVLACQYPPWYINLMGVMIVGDLASYHDREELAHRQATKTSYQTLRCESDDQPCISDHGIHFHDTTYSVRHSKDKALNLSILRVSRQVRRETLGLVYKDLSFTLHEFAAIPFLKDVSSISRANMMHVTLVFTWHSHGPNTVHIKTLERNLRFFTEHRSKFAILSSNLPTTSTRSRKETLGCTSLPRSMRPRRRSSRSGSCS